MERNSVQIGIGDFREFEGNVVELHLAFELFKDFALIGAGVDFGDLEFCDITFFVTKNVTLIGKIKFLVPLGFDPVSVTLWWSECCG